MSDERVRVEVEDGVATITIDRPKALNALDAQTLDELEAAIDEVAVASGVHGAILTGGGEKAFVAGADISQLVDVTTADAARKLARRGQELCAKISACPRPVIACVNGFALGGGLELALACHFRYVVEGAKLGLPEVTLGLIPGYGGTQRLSRAVGRGPATELILTGKPIDSAEALRIGLANKVFETKDAMLAAARETLTTIGKRGPVAVRLALEAIERGLNQDLPGGLAVEADLFGVACSTDDAAEGLRAFLDKRKAAFTGA
jgi:enoyl-CoA hydratase